MFQQRILQVRKIHSLILAHVRRIVEAQACASGKETDGYESIRMAYLCLGLFPYLHLAFGESRYFSELHGVFIARFDWSRLEINLIAFIR